VGSIMDKYVLDIETTGLDKKADKINMVGVLNLDTNQTHQTESLMDYVNLHKKLDLENSLAIMHNAKFDTDFLELKYKVRFTHPLDTVILYYLYNPYRKSYALKVLTKDLFNYEYDVDLATKTGTGQATKDYNLIDCQMTGLLFKYCTSKMSEKEVKLAEYLTKIDRVYQHITDRGIPIDKDLCKKELASTVKQLNDLYNRISKQTGNINLNSSKQLADLLFNKLKYKPYKKTKTGAWSVDTETMKSYDTDLARDLIEYKRLEKLKSSFLAPYSVRDRIHPRFNIMTTVSGRTSSSKPNLQQLPRGATVRNLILVPDDSYYFFEIDYSQMELRCAGQIAHVKELINSYNRDEDIHVKTAKAVSGKDEVTEDERFQAKAVNFGFLFGMSAETFVLYAKNSYGVSVTLEEAKRIRDNYFKTYPELNQYYVDIENEVKKYGYIENPVGRRRRVIKGMGDYERGSFINSKIQGFASDILVLSLLEISELPEYDKDFIVYGTVHDSILGCVKKDKLDVINKITNIMEHPTYVNDLMDGKFILPIKADVSIFEERWYGKKVIL
jgi:DNA polymerase-1